MMMCGSESGGGYTRLQVSPRSALRHRTARARVYHLGVHGVEGEKADRMAELKHAPGPSAVFGDVGTRHVAGHQHQIRIMRTYRGVKLRTPAPGTEDAPRIVTRRRITCAFLCHSGRARRKYDGNKDSGQGRRPDDGSFHRRFLLLTSAEVGFAFSNPGEPIT